ncbi:hypothetical protein E1301_Tti004734 [Triplophysa tibetana]|uniref:Uncharacterized protein n=1 Tax=Triplophysa tibetana TaxID=1572043 RepID=A0A5A9NA87_9TELE|nr:hypothetical protein E1301_Tti004734 [Triplophysa tibetana]
METSSTLSVRVAYGVSRSPKFTRVIDSQRWKAQKQAGFLNTSCTAISEKRSRRRRSSALFTPSDYQSTSLSLPRLGRKDSAARPAICQSGPGGYAWLCPGRTACRRADVDERKRYAN